MKDTYYVWYQHTPRKFGLYHCVNAKFAKEQFLKEAPDAMILKRMDLNQLEEEIASAT